MSSLEFSSTPRVFRATQGHSGTPVENHWSGGIFPLEKRQQNIWNKLTLFSLDSVFVFIPSRPISPWGNVFCCHQPEVSVCQTDFKLQIDSKWYSSMLYTQQRKQTIRCQTFFWEFTKENKVIMMCHPFLPLWLSNRDISNNLSLSLHFMVNFFELFWYLF